MKIIKKPWLILLLGALVITWYIYPAFTESEVCYETMSNEMAFITDISALIDSSDLIVIGQYVEPRSFGHQFHFPSNEPLWKRMFTRSPKQPHTWHWSLYYNLDVDRYFKGTGRDSIVVRLPYFWGGGYYYWMDWLDTRPDLYKLVKPSPHYIAKKTEANPSRPLPPFDKTSGVIAPTFIEPTPGATVVLFLGGNDGQRSEPYMFKLAGEKLYVQSNIPEVIEAFPPITLAEFVEMIGD